MARFVILHHCRPVEAVRRDHWDLLLDCDPLDPCAEAPSVCVLTPDAGRLLQTWALAVPPEAEGAIGIEQLAPHRRRYLEYEGPLSGNRGSVTRWDQGVFQLDTIAAGAWRVELRGTRARGELDLSCREGRWKAYWRPTTTSDKVSCQ